MLHRLRGMDALGQFLPLYCMMKKMNREDRKNKEKARGQLIEYSLSDFNIHLLLSTYQRFNVKLKISIKGGSQVYYV